MVSSGRPTAAEHVPDSVDTTRGDRGSRTIGDCWIYVWDSSVILNDILRVDDS